MPKYSVTTLIAAAAIAASAGTALAQSALTASIAGDNSFAGPGVTAGTSLGANPGARFASGASGASGGASLGGALGTTESLSGRPFGVASLGTSDHLIDQGTVDTNAILNSAGARAGAISNNDVVGGVSGSLGSLGQPSLTSVGTPNLGSSAVALGGMTNTATGLAGGVGTSATGVSGDVMGSVGSTTSAVTSVVHH